MASSSEDNPTPDDGVEAEQVLFTDDETARLFLAANVTGEKSAGRRELITEAMEDLRFGAQLLEQILAGAIVIDIEVNAQGEDELVYFSAHESWAAELSERAARKIGETP